MVVETLRVDLLDLRLEFPDVAGPVDCIALEERVFTFLVSTNATSLTWTVFSFSVDLETETSTTSFIDFTASETLLMLALFLGTFLFFFVVALLIPDISTFRTLSRKSSWG